MNKTGIFSRFCITGNSSIENIREKIRKVVYKGNLGLIFADTHFDDNNPVEIDGFIGSFKNLDIVIVPGSRENQTSFSSKKSHREYVSLLKKMKVCSAFTREIIGVGKYLYHWFLYNLLSKRK